MQRLWKIGKHYPTEKVGNDKSAIDIGYKGIINRKLEGKMNEKSANIKIIDRYRYRL
jgi:hypothetical protein